MKIEDNALIPKTTHFAALVFKKHDIFHEGDERSRTHPGHGYPEYTETIHTIEYQVFKGQLDMENWVLAMETKRDKTVYQLIEVKPITATLKTSVIIG